jgi:hypothetical protein
VTCGVVGFANNPLHFFSENSDIFNTLGNKARRDLLPASKTAQRVGAAERVPGWRRRRRGLGLELAAAPVVIISMVSRFLGTWSGTRLLPGTNHVDEEYNDVNVASLASAMKRLWQESPRPQACVQRTTPTEAGSEVIFLLPAPAAFSCRGRLAWHIGLGSGWGSQRQQGPAGHRSFMGIARMPSSASWSLTAHASASTCSTPSSYIVENGRRDPRLADTWRRRSTLSPCRST